MTVQFENKQTGSTLQEMVSDPNRFCVFLPPGVFLVSVDSIKYFVPGKLEISVPQKGSDAFIFNEFHGDIQGKLDCPLDKCPGVIIQLKNQG